ncbi:MAG: MFS transporter, partial [Candidatus Heimdallarchaeota archaeon]|nr:MFS transporter [Candidatus Heimdallarchaeota archaeon]
MIIDFTTDFLGFDSIEDLAVFTLILTGSGIFGYFFWSAISNKKGKNLTLKAGLICNIFSLPTTILLGKIDFISNYNQGLIFAALIGFSFSSVYLLSYAIIADIIDNEERKTKINKSGLYSGFNTIPYNLAQTIGIFISGLIVYNLGIMGPIAAIFIGISLVYSRNSN